MKFCTMVVFVCAVLCFDVHAQTNKPNIVLFLVDDMGLMDTSVPMLTDKAGKPRRHPLNDCPCSIHCRVPTPQDRILVMEKVTTNKKDIP